MSGRKIIKVTEEEIAIVKSLREEGLTTKEIAVRMGIKPDRVAALCKRYKIKVTEDQLSKLMSNTAKKRAPFSKEVIVRRSASIKEAYKNPKLKEIKSAQFVGWWKSLTKEAKKEYLDKRTLAMKESPKMAEYMAYCKTRKGDLNHKTQVLLKRENVDSSPELMTKYAKEHDGFYVSGYVNSGEDCNWECKHSHKFSMRPNSVQQGQWCPFCATIISKGHQEIIDFINSLGFDLKAGININNRTAITPKELDIYIPEFNFGIEYNGLYFHSEFNPNRLSGDHFSKFKVCKQNGINLLAIFEDEWENKKELIKGMIKWRLNKFDGQRIHPRKCKLIRLDKNKQFEDFFERNHLEGQTTASFAYGLFFEDKLIMCASVRKNFNKEIELARLATNFSYYIPGGASKLIKAIVSEIKLPLVSFSDNRLSLGNVYSKLGFDFVAVTPPSYWYTDNRVRLWRFKCKRINDQEILEEYPTEREQALGGIFSKKYLGHDKPLYKIEGYGNQKWILQPKEQNK